MKKIILSALLSLAPFVAHADFAQGSNALLANFGFNAAGVLIGFDYEHGYDRTYGLGGYFRMYPEKEKTSGNHQYSQAGVTAVGGFIRPHFNRQNWDFYVSPGFGFFSYDKAGSAVDAESLMGPSLGIGLLYEITANISFGIEDFMIVGWFGEDAYRGVASEEITAKFRFIF